MTDLRKAAEMALEALRNAEIVKMEQLEAMYALQEALAQPEQEPVAWMLGDNFYTVKQCNLFGQDSGKEKPNQIPLYTAPPKREWVGLTKEEFEQAVDGLEDLEDCWIQIESKLKEKNS